MNFAVSTFTLASLAIWLGIVLFAATFRGRLYAIFSAIVLGLYTAIGVAVLPRLPLPGPAVYYLHGAAYLSWLLLISPKLRPEWFRALVSYPGLTTSAAVLLAWPWALLVAFGFEPRFVWLPFALATFGLAQSLFTRRSEVVLRVGSVEGPDVLSRVRTERTKDENLPALRVIQLTDPHLGPFMSVRRLRGVCERIVNEDPDLVLLTGDFLTMESQTEGTHLDEALAPLRALSGRTFACLGNHDHEALPLVVRGLASAGVRLLVDDATSVETRLGVVDVVGFDFHFRERKTKLAMVVERFPRRDRRLRLGLLHDPGAFRHLPPGEFDLVLSGHTHGGHVGLVSLGFPGTVVSWIARMPDHGLWGRGSDRLYVHRGTGHYGYPIRLGVPAEESVLVVQKA